MMSATPSPADIATSLLAKQGFQLQSLEILQRLWAGYGYVCRVTAITIPSSDLSASTTNSETTAKSYIIKLITPPPADPDDEGHIRKILSYQVEQYFYTHLAPEMPSNIPVAKCFASINEHHENGTSTTAMMLTDLRDGFPVAGEKRGVLNETQVNAALGWLSSFHGFWWASTQCDVSSSLVKPPLEEGNSERAHTVWLNGGYTYLETRRSEYDYLRSDLDSEWCKPLTDVLENGASLSEMVAAVLAPSENGLGRTADYQTIIHGDVKSENLFTTASGEDVVFYDFQYIGLGLGVCDLAKLFTCSVPLEMLSGRNIPEEVGMEDGETKLLLRYLDNLRKVSGKSYGWDTFVQHWETALVDWLRFQASWGFWGNTEWLGARVRSILKDERWRKNLITAYRSL